MSASFAFDSAVSHRTAFARTRSRYGAAEDGWLSRIGKASVRGLYTTGRAVSPLLQGAASWSKARLADLARVSPTVARAVGGGMRRAYAKGRSVVGSARKKASAAAGRYSRNIKRWARS